MMTNEKTTCYRAHLENGKHQDLYYKYWTLNRLVTTSKKKKNGEYLVELDYIPLYSVRDDSWIFITQKTELVWDIDLVDLVRV